MTTHKSTPTDEQAPQSPEKCGPTKPGKQGTAAPDNLNSSRLDFVDLGVWRVWFEKSTSRFPFRTQELSQIIDFATLFRFLHDIFKISPSTFVFLVVMKIWNGLEPVVLLSLSSRLLNLIEAGLSTKKPDARAIINAITLRVLCVLVATFLRWLGRHQESIMKSRMTMFYEKLILKARLKTDVSTAREDDFGRYSAGALNAWVAWYFISNLGSKVFSIVGQLGFLLHMAHSNWGGPVFVLCCLARPFLVVWTRKSLFEKPYVIECVNEDYKKLKALQGMATASYRAEVISGNLDGWIFREFEKALAGLSKVSIDSAVMLYGLHSVPYERMFSALAEDLPLIYYAVNAILNPAQLSLTSIATLQQSSRLMRSVLDDIYYDIGESRRKTGELKRLYDLESEEPALKDGELSHPSTQSEKLEKKGMEFELREVSFTYPGSKSTTNALRNISCTISAGQLVVIVGPNGSGKSTLIKLLSRLYDPTSGTILLDGHPLPSYKLSDIRESTAMLTQEHSIFPLSLYDNIAIGNWENGTHEMEEVRRASELGGAAKLIDKFEKGYETVIQTSQPTYGVRVSERDVGPLGVKLKEAAKSVSVSGGEKQRIVASRTFMRLLSERISFLAVDEPSSAMDPEGELQLFENLRSHRQGKTVIFVTHRFGHLTKHADLIICMKEGSIAETGTHKELIVKGGEYAKLYNIQAHAFDNSTSTDS
ncbi:hypothetical protein AX16_004158 [Volvariella volvacea WC 439]|nr:hypothetical protein AX16_004158 [Volvariella volvacea WC 439]